MDQTPVDAIAQLVTAHPWLAVAPLLNGFIVRLSKEDVKPARFNVPASWRPFLATGLALLFAGFDKLVFAETWQVTVIGFLLAAGLPGLAHSLVIEGARDGKELPIPGLMRRGQGGGGGAAAAFLFVLLLGPMGLTGCINGKMIPLPKVAAALSNGQNDLAIVQTMVDQFFAGSGANQELHAQIQEKIDAVRLGLNAAIKVVSGAEDLSNQQLAVAFLKFNGAWADLMLALRTAGILGDDGQFKAAAGAHYHPPVLEQPMALQYRIQ